MIRFVLFFCILFPLPVQAELVSLRVAVAANFISAMETLIPLFAEKYGVAVQSTFGSSGKLYAQIKNGAPYDLFFSADQKRPQLLNKAGICEEPFSYGLGSVVLWTWDTAVMAGSWKEILQSNKGKVAIANPATAPYGTVALQALQANGLADSIKPRLVYGQSAGQAFVFAQTRNTRFGLIPLSLALSEQGRIGKYWALPEADTVDQGGCIIKTSGNRKAVQDLLDFFDSDAASEVFTKLGYAR